MSDNRDSRSLEKALADLRKKYDRTPENSARARLELERMIKALEAEIAERRRSGEG